MIKIVPLFLLILLAGGCGVKNTASSEQQSSVPEKFPVEKTIRGERIKAGRTLAENYINALNSSLAAGDFTILQKVLPKNTDSKRAQKIFDSMRTGLARYGKLAECRFLTRLDCTLYMDYLWKYKFVRKTGDPQMPEQIFEVLYRVRVICPDGIPMIVNADFMFR